jgi:formylglycine-generating enzyme required for sulfatase activity/uncharacterized caspase-like protein
MRKLALLIGVSEYESGLEPLPAAVRDVVAVQRVLADPDRGGFAASDITVLQNPDRQTMEDAIYHLFADRQKDDLVLLYFSGHGVKDDQSKLYFVTPRTRKTERGDLIKPTAVSASTIHDYMNSSRAKRQVVVLDCCYSGAFAMNMVAKAAQTEDISADIRAQLGSEGRIVLTSSTATQYSLGLPNEELSVYTRYLVEGLTTGAADLDSDGDISVDELHEYTSSKVREAEPAMKPEIYVVREGYRIKLARAPVGDPRLIYRKEVEESLRSNHGEISYLDRPILDSRRLDLSLPSDVAEAIEAEVLRPYQERQKRLEIYRQTWQEVIQRESQISEAIRTKLRRLQQTLKLRDEDTAQIEAAFPLPTSPSRPTSPPSFTSFTENLGNGIALDMIAIPGGTFWMGAAQDEEGASSDEYPQHQVTIAPFYMGKFPVTQAQWKAIAALPKMNADLDAKPSYFKGDNLPIEQVSWDDAIEFCARLSHKTGKPYRLPSEAEWEYACRAGTTTPFYFGDTISTEQANYDGNHTYGSVKKGQYREKTTPVESFAPNSFGLYDMHGNVWEWCQDVWHGNYENAPENKKPWEDGDDRDFRLLRGGSWDDFPQDCRSAYRRGLRRDAQNNDIGFRVACAPPRILSQHT